MIIIMTLTSPKFASAANALMRISVKQKYFQFLLERVQRYVCRPRIVDQSFMKISPQMLTLSTEVLVKFCRSALSSCSPIYLYSSKWL